MDERTDQVTPNESTKDIRRDIERTQREMSETIDEIQYRLSPRHLKEQTKASVRRAGVRTSRGVMDHVKGNPIGAAMVGVGLMLLMRSPHRDDYEYDVDFDADFDDRGYRGSANRYRSAGFDDPYYAGRSYGVNRGDELDEHGRLDEVKDRVAAGVDAARERVSEIGDRAHEMTDEVRDRARHAADTARFRARQLRHRTANRFDLIGRESRDVLMDTPLIAGIAAIALGALAGALIPESERENELFGEKSDRLTHRAGELVRETLDHGKDIARAATTAATDAAKRETDVAKEELKQNLSDNNMFR